MRVHLQAPLLALLVLFGSGCFAQTQRYPSIMQPAVDPLPPGTKNLHPGGPEEVLIVRIADPVHVRRPGEASSFPMYFYSKQSRMSAGTWVFSGAGGRLEVLYPGNTSIMLFGLCSGVVGSESRGEPIFFFRQLDRARIVMQEGQQVRLLAGVVLTADGGPFVIERPTRDIMRVRNRSTSTGRIAYREEIFHLDPGHVIDLPLLEGLGGAPQQADPGFQTMLVGAAPLRLRGDVEVLPSDARGTRIRANGDHEMRGLGLRVRLDPGDEILFSDLSVVTAGVRPIGARAAAPELVELEPVQAPTQNTEGPDSPDIP